MGISECDNVSRLACASSKWRRRLTLDSCKGRQWTNLLSSLTCRVCRERCERMQRAIRRTRCMAPLSSWLHQTSWRCCQESQRRCPCLDRATPQARPTFGSVRVFWHLMGPLVYMWSTTSCVRQLRDVMVSEVSESLSAIRSERTQEQPNSMPKFPHIYWSNCFVETRVGCQPFHYNSKSSRRLSIKRVVLPSAPCLMRAAPLKIAPLLASIACGPFVSSSSSRF